MLDLHKGAKDFERFHLQAGPPVPRVMNLFGLVKRVTWRHLILPDGSPGVFTSWWLFGHLQWYHGTAKCDGTRTRMAWAGQLGDPVALDQYVMTTTPSEMRAFRWRSKGPSDPTWDNQGGS